MIATLRGKIDIVTDDWLVVNVGGVGYRVFATSSTIHNAQIEQSVSMFIHTHVRDDAILLYGFLDHMEQKLFEIIITVSGVGPRLALTTLSQLSVAQFVRAVVSGDRQTLMQVSGIGRKTADRLILELKDKLQNWAAALPAEAEPAATVSAGASTAQQDVIDALVGLGYTAEQSESTVQPIFAQQPDIAVEDALRLALRGLQSE